MGPHPGRTVATHDGVTLHLEEVGVRSDPGLLLLHGVGSSGRFLREAFAGPTLAAGWRLVTVDLRGHGGSSAVTDPADHALERHVADVAAVAEATAPEVIGGVSLGGHAAVAAAVAGVPCRGVLACLPAWTGRAVPGHGPHAAVATEVERVGADGMVERFRHDTTMHPWLRDLLVRDWTMHDPASLDAALVALDGAQAPTTDEVRALPVPLALVGWPDDPGHPLDVARDWALLAPRTHLEVTSLDAMAAGPEAMGRAAVTALGRLGLP